MVVVPKEKPFVENLNSYYLNVKKLVEHFQGEIGTGAVHFQSPKEEGFIVFDKDDILNGCYQNKTEKVVGEDAIDHLMKTAESVTRTANILNSFIVSGYGYRVLAWVLAL